VHDIGILDNLEIKHADTNEIGTAAEGIFKSVFGRDSPCGKDLVSDPGGIACAEEFRHFLRRSAPHIIMELIPVEAVIIQVMHEFTPVF
jgi:hypothetical protein